MLSHLSNTGHEPEGHSSRRIHALDHLRAFAMLLGVVIHAVIPFITDPGADVWPARNREQGAGFDLIAGVIHSFRMQLFFLISGFFGRLVHERSGTRGFIRHRLLRIGLPFAVGMLTVVQLVHWLWDLELNPGATAHLWFLEYLLIYSMAVAVLGRWSPANPIDRVARYLLSSAWKPLLLAVPTAFLMLWSPVWDERTNARGTTLLPNFPALAYYALFFVYGWAMHRHIDLLPVFRRGSVWQMILGFATLIAWGLVYKSSNYTNSTNFLYVLAGSSIAWLFSLAFIALFLNHFDNPTSRGRYLADSAYWVYLAHLPLVIALQKWIVPSGMNPWLEFALINAIAFPILLLSYEYLVRYTFIGEILNGKRQRKVRP